jgi:hypothetical protein
MIFILPPEGVENRPKSYLEPLARFFKAGPLSYCDWSDWNPGKKSQQQKSASVSFTHEGIDACYIQALRRHTAVLSQCIICYTAPREPRLLSSGRPEKLLSRPGTTEPVPFTVAAREIISDCFSRREAELSERGVVEESMVLGRSKRQPFMPNRNIMKPTDPVQQPRRPHPHPRVTSKSTCRCVVCYNT